MFTDVNLMQPENARSPMDFTEFGIIAEVRLWQSPNAHSPMEVTELGISMDAFTHGH